MCVCGGAGEGPGKKGGLARQLKSPYTLSVVLPQIYIYDDIYSTTFGHARTARAWPRLFGCHSCLLGLNLKFSSQQLWACLTTRFCTCHCH